MILSFFKLRRCKKILKYSLRTYRKKKKYLSSSQTMEIKEAIEKLHTAILDRDVPLACERSHYLEDVLKKRIKKTFFRQLFDTVSSLAVALVIAIIIRQMWFEFYEIPSGSMRPTFKEQDRLVVSKTQFGINFPLRATHLLFEPNEVERGGIVIFTGENMDIPDVKTRYFYIFPGTKQYIKRMIGLPGDTLYFYGGKIYGIDKKGRDITPKYQGKSFEGLEHIPFIHLEGKTVTPKSGKTRGPSSVFIHQMNMPIAQLSPYSKTGISSQLLLSPKTSPIHEQTHFDLYDLWGMGNYATARLLTQEQLFEFYRPTTIQRAEYYLELTHHANLEHAKIQEDLLGRMRPVVGSYVSIIPLEQKHLEKLWQNMYTARFVVKNGYGMRYGLEDVYSSTYHSFLPKLRGYIPDGTYEFQNGIAYQVKWQGLTEKLSNSHPLATFDPERLFVLFNTGMEFDTRFVPGQFHHTLSPARYAYFRDGDLYLLGAPIFSKDDPLLQEFIKTEIAKSETSYYPSFIDNGPPIKADGTIDRMKIEKYGITIPEDHYLVLGDNHAMSADSRDFGFVPKDNIRGIPSFIFWASGSRFGYPNQLAYPIFTTPRLIVWTLALIIFVLWKLYHRRRYQEILGPKLE